MNAQFVVTDNHAEFALVLRKQIRKMIRELIIAIGTVAALTSCSAGNTPADDVDSISSDLYFTNAPTAHWLLTHDTNGLGTGRGADIPICYTTPFLVGASDETGTDWQQRTDFLSSDFRPAFENTWSRIADINLTGWDQCGTNNAGKLVVQVTNSASCQLWCNINQNGVDSCPKKCFDQSWSSSNVGSSGAGAAAFLTINRTTAITRDPVESVHEQGHALGFFHEFDRSDWVPQPSCSSDDFCTSQKIGDACTAGHCSCSSDAACSNGDTCINNVCANPNGTKISANADFDSVLAATYFNNYTNSNTNGKADTIQSLSAQDAIGVQQVYGTKADGSIVGLGGRCLRASANGILTYFDCMSDGSDIFPVQYEAVTTIPPAVRAAQYYRKLVNPYGANQCWTATGSSIALSSCQSPLPTSQQFYISSARLRAMGNMCVAASGAAAGSTLQLQTCGAVSSDLERWDWVGNSLVLSGTSMCVTLPSDAAKGSRPTLIACDSGQSNPSLRGHQNFVWGGKQIGFGNLRLNILGGKPNPGSAIGLWDGNTINTYFYFTGRIRAVSNGKCLDLPGSHTQNGRAVNLYTCGAVGQPNQEWDYHF